jgi:coenzyme F420-0:L-glutamate ligase / coenzyme F420-1:gamma-L-glutamate ligase
MQITAVHGIGEVDENTHLATLIAVTTDLHDDDVVVVTSKIVAKAEGRVVACDRNDEEARQALIQSETVRTLRRRGPLSITETKHGFVCANAGIDWSNVQPAHAVLLPVDPDRSARKIRDGLKAITGKNVAVLITDTFGRAWRNGVVDVAIGCAGITAIDDHAGRTDSYGNTLVSTQVCVVDQLAAAAALVMEKTAQTPVAIIRGFEFSKDEPSSVRADVVRSPATDLFR